MTNPLAELDLALAQIFDPAAVDVPGMSEEEAQAAHAYEVTVLCDYGHEVKPGEDCAACNHGCSAPAKDCPGRLG